MDDVLDSFRPVHVHGDIYGRVPIVVPVLLRGEDSPRAMAPLSCYQRVVDFVQEVCTPGAVQARAGTSDS